MLVAVASSKALAVTLHQDGCPHLRTVDDYNLIGRHTDPERLKEIALEVYEPETAKQIKFRKGSCLR